MKIFKISIFLTIFLVITSVYGVHHFSSYLKMSKNIEKRSEIINSLSSDIYDLMLLSHETVLYDTENIKEHWLRKHKRTSGLIEEIFKFKTLKNEELIENLALLNKKLKAVFFEFLKIKEIGYKNKEFDYYVRIQSSNLFSISSELNKNILIFQKNNVAEISYITKELNKDIIYILSLTAVLAVVALLFIWFRLIRPIVTISAKMPYYFDSENSFRFKWKYSDEIGVFVDSFNDTLDKRAEWEESLKMTNKKLSEARQEAEKASRAKSSFLANMSHEIRTPLNGIIGLSSLMLDLELTFKQKDYMGKIDRAANALLTLLNDILDISKIEAGKMELNNHDFRLEDLFTELNDLFLIKAEEKKIELRIDGGDAVPEVLKGDSFRLKQILMNLLSNAVKFTDRGSVVLDVKTLERDTDKIKLAFAVRDTGIGIPAEDMDKLFRLFSQVDGSTSRKFGGTGLGLAISKNLAELMGGNIVAESVVGEGSIFRFNAVFELGNESAMKSKKEEEAALSDSVNCLEGKKILLVEDNKINRLVAEMVLKKFDTDVETAVNGEMALEKMNTKKYDLVLVDLHMPVIDGYETTRRIRKKYDKNELPIVALTAAAMDNEKEKCIKAGMNDHIAKPVHPDDLYIKLCRHISGKNVDMDKVKLPGMNSVGEELKLDGFNFEHIAESLSNDWTLLRSTLVEFRKEFENFEKQFSRCLERDSLMEVWMMLYNLESSVEDIGAVKLVEEIKKLKKEENFRNHEKRADFFKEFNLIMKNLDFSGRSEIDSRYAESKNNVEINDLLNNILSVMKKRNIVSDELMNRLSAALFEYPEIYDKISSEIYEFNYEQAADIIEAAIATLELNKGEK